MLERRVRVRWMGLDSGLGVRVRVIGYKVDWALHTKKGEHLEVRVKSQ